MSKRYIGQAPSHVENNNSNVQTSFVYFRPPGASGSAEFDENGDVGGYIGKFVVDGDGYKQVEIVE